METLIYHEYTGTFPDGRIEVRLIADKAEYPPKDYFLSAATIEKGDSVEMTGGYLDDCYLRE